jgi:hypothetical protein
MTTLHDLLKRDEADDRAPQAPRVDLRGRYSPIGISAVAAACRYSSGDDTRTDRTNQDRIRLRR